MAALFILICVVLGLLNKSAELEATPDLEAETEAVDPLIQTDDYTIEDTGIQPPAPEGVQDEGAEGAEGVEQAEGAEVSSGEVLQPLSSPDLLIEDIIRSEQEEAE